MNFNEQFERQLNFLARSCEAFDVGYSDEAIRIAVSLRVLLHDTANSTSLITHLGAQPLKLLSTVRRRSFDPSVFAYDGVTRWTGAGPVAKLGLGVEPEEVPFQEWWKQVLYIPRQGVSITRRTLVLTAANKDGGAHVDASLTPDYEALLSMWVRQSSDVGRDPVPVSDVHLIGLRQLGYEVLHSPQILRLRSNTTGEVDLQFLLSQAHRFTIERDLDSAVLFLMMAATISPNNAEIHQKLGILYGQRGELNKAEGELQRAVELAPQDHIARRNLGIALREKGVYEQAEVQFRKAIAIQPMDQLSYLGLSNVFIKQNQFQRALEECTVGLQLIPDSDILNSNAGSCLLKLGDAEAALSNFQKSCLKSPNVAHFRINRACALSALGRTEAALKDVAAAIDLDPKVRDIIKAEEDLHPLHSDPRFQELLRQRGD
jgi:tetratricopeptide (TPR) repeat protein